MQKFQPLQKIKEFFNANINKELPRTVYKTYLEVIE